jgi:PAS domain S-box-containing protein
MATKHKRSVKPKKPVINGKISSSEKRGIHLAEVEKVKHEQAEKTLFESDRMFRLISENSRDIICLHGPDHRYTYVSPACKEILGYTPEELVGSNPWELVYPEDLGALRKVGQEQSSEGQPILLSYRIRKKSGEFIWFESVSRMLKDDKGSILGFVTSSRDITKRKLMEDALRESEELYRKYFELGLVGMAIASPTGEWIEVNDKLCEIYGYSYDELMKKHWTDLTYPEDLDKDLESFRRIQRGEIDRYSLEKRYIRKDGKIINCIISIGCRRHPNRELAYIYALVVDITNLRQVEEELRKALQELVDNEKRLKRAEEIAHLGSWELDLTNNTLIWSDEVYRIFGLKPQEFDGTYEAFLDAVHPEDRSAVDTACSESIRKGMDSYEIEHRIVRKSTGEIRHLQEKCQHFMDEAGKIVRSTGMVHDISERKKAEKTLYESEEKFRLFVEKSVDGIILIDEFGYIIEWNKSEEQITGIPQSEALGKPLWEIQLLLAPEEMRTPELLHTAREKILCGLNEGPALRRVFEEEIQRPDGSRRTIQSVVFPVPGSKGISLVGSIVRDITESKKVERIKDDFIGMISHELKTPITVIMGALATATDKRVTPEQARELLNDAIQQTETLANLVENLLELSREQSKRLIMLTKPTDIHEIARYVTQKLGDKSSIHRIILNFANELPLVLVDQLRAERIIYNLVDNAIKYSPKGGEVRISARQDGDYLVISISDQGPGISPDEQIKLFQSFERLGMKVNRSIQGTGLGLRVCRILVEAHNGKIWVESEKGKGATFCFTLPIAK